MQIPARFLAPFLTYARLRQAPVSRIPEMADYPEPMLADRFTAMPVEVFLAVLSAIVTHLPGEDLGLRVGRSMELAHIGIVYELSLRTTSLQGSITLLPRLPAPVAALCTDHLAGTACLHSDRDNAGKPAAAAGAGRFCGNAGGKGTGGIDRQCRWHCRGGRAPGGLPCTF